MMLSILSLATTSSNTSLDDVLNQVATEIQTELQGQDPFAEPSFPLSLQMCLKIIKAALQNQTMLQSTMSIDNTALSSAISSIISNTPNPLGNTVAINTQNITDLQTKTTGVVYNSTSKTTIDSVNIPTLNNTVSSHTNSINTLNTKNTGIAYDTNTKTTIDNVNIPSLNSTVSSHTSSVNTLFTRTTGLAYDSNNKTSIDGTKMSDLVTTKTNTQGVTYSGGITSVDGVAVSGLNTTVAGHTSSINSLNTNLGTANTNIGNLQNKTTGLVYDSTNKTTIDGTKFSDVVSGNITPITSLNTTVAGNTTSINTLNTNLGTANTNITNLQTKTTGLAYDATNKTSIDGTKFSDVVAGNIAPITSLNTSVSGLSTSMTTANNNISNLNTSINTANTNIGNLQTKTTGVTYSGGVTSVDGVSVAGLNTTVSGHTSSINTLNTKNTGIVYDSTNKTTIDSVNIPSLNTTVSGHTTSIGTANTNITNLQNKTSGISYDSTNKTTIDSINIPNLNTTVSGNTSSIGTLNTKTSGITYSGGVTSIDGLSFNNIKNEYYSDYNNVFRDALKNIKYIKYTTGLSNGLNSYPTTDLTTLPMLNFYSDTMFISGLSASNTFTINSRSTSGGYLLNISGSYFNPVVGSSDMCVILYGGKNTSSTPMFSFNLTNAVNQTFKQFGYNNTFRETDPNFISSPPVVNAVTGSSNKSILASAGYLYATDTYYQVYVYAINGQHVAIIGIGSVLIYCISANQTLFFTLGGCGYRDDEYNFLPFGAKPGSLGTYYNSVYYDIGTNYSLQPFYMWMGTTPITNFVLTKWNNLTCNVLGENTSNFSMSDNGTISASPNQVIYRLQQYGQLVCNVTYNPDNTLSQIYLSCPNNSTQTVTYTFN